MPPVSVRLSLGQSMLVCSNTRKLQVRWTSGPGSSGGNSVNTTPVQDIQPATVYDSLANCLEKKGLHIAPEKIQTIPPFLYLEQWFLTWAIMPPRGRFHFSGGRWNEKGRRGALEQKGAVRGRWSKPNL